MDIERHSRLTCPECGAVELCEMPEHACVYFHVCCHCQRRLQPLAGDCCVFCSYGDSPCPPRRGPGCGDSPSSVDDQT